MNRTLLPLLLAVTFCVSAVAQPRLIGYRMNNLFNGNSASDSTRVVYKPGNTNSGDAAHMHTQSIVCDTFTMLTLRPGVSGWQWWEHITRTFNAAGLTDTESHYYAQLHPATRHVYTYNAAKNVTQFIVNR